MQRCFCSLRQRANVRCYCVVHWLWFRDDCITGEL